VNRAELVASMNRVSSKLLKEKGYISFVDVLIQMGKLTKENYESWRMKRIPYLERVIGLNLGKLNYLRRTLRQNAVRGHLRPSKGTGFINLHSAHPLFIFSEFGPLARRRWLRDADTDARNTCGTPRVETLPQRFHA